MKIQLDQNLIRLARQSAFPIYAVGGIVRDGIAGLFSPDQDVDICAPVDTETFVKTASACGAAVEAVYSNTGTVKLAFGKNKYEFSCFRSDEYVRGVHTPVKTFFTDDILLDARRRDFKCNAVYYDIAKDCFVDPLGGIADIKNKRLSTVREADRVFGEDGLRLMRLARQAAQLGFTPDGECMAGAKQNCRLIADISVERIYAELSAILKADLRYGVKNAQYRGLKILEETGVLAIILPELAAGKGMPQRTDFHLYDVLEHSLRTVLYAPADIRLAALLHDVGKPYCMQTEGSFHNHEQEGERIAGDICRRLKVPKKTTTEVQRLVKLHMYDLSGQTHENKIRRIIIRNGDIFFKLLGLKQADFSACKDDLSEAPCVTRWKSIYNKMREEGAPMSLKELKIKGDEVLALGAEPPLVGELLNELLEECAFNPRLNNNDKLVRWVKKRLGVKE